MSTKKIVCPSWCRNTRSGCKGEHMGDQRYVPASGGTDMKWRLDQDGEGAHLPYVSTSTMFSQFPGDEDPAPFVSLYTDSDSGASLTAPEFRRLIADLTKALAEIEDGWR